MYWVFFSAAVLSIVSLSVPVRVLVLVPYVFFVLLTVACSFPLKTTTMIFNQVAAVLSNIKLAGGIVSVTGQTLTDCIIVDRTTPLQTE